MSSDVLFGGQFPDPPQPKPASRSRPGRSATGQLPGGPQRKTAPGGVRILGIRPRVALTPVGHRDGRRDRGSRKKTTPKHGRSTERSLEPARPCGAVRLLPSTHLG